MKAIYLTTLLPVLGLGLATLEARAETWPSKPVRAIVPFAAGSTTDIVPRVVFDQLSSQLGQSIVVENRAGAGGTIGSSFVAKAEPDGYTLLAHGSALTISPALYSDLSFDPARDFAAVIPLGIYAERVGCTAGSGLEDSWRLGRRCQGEAGRAQLLLGWRRQRNPSERRALPAQRGGGRSARSVQGRG